MNNKVQSSEIGFALKQIVTKQFAVIEEAFTGGCPVSMAAELKFATNKEDRAIAVSAEFKFLTCEKSFLLIEVTCFFEIKEDSWKKFSGNGNETCIPKNFLCYLAMHTVGTARGVLHAKTENTKYNCYILPPINVTEMVRNDLIL